MGMESIPATWVSFGEDMDIVNVPGGVVMHHECSAEGRDETSIATALVFIPGATVDDFRATAISSNKDYILRQSNARLEEIVDKL